LMNENLGQFDIALFNSIIYHILDPMQAVLNMARIAKHVLTIETHMDLAEPSKPAMVFYRGEKAAPGFPQNGWGVNS